MKKRNKLLLFFLMLLASFSLLTLKAEAAEIVLNANDDLRTKVQVANSGDTLNLNGQTFLVNDNMSNSEPWLIDKNITIKNGKIDLRAGGIILGGDVTFENIQLSFPNPIRNVIAANGYTLTLTNTSRVKNAEGKNLAQQIHLVCGSMYSANGKVGTVTIPEAGSKGKIIITGDSVDLGNIYAGSLSTDGSLAASSIPAEITINVSDNSNIGLTHTASIGNNVFTVESGIYASGALQTPGPGLILDTSHVQLPPVPSPNCPVDAQVTININGNSVKQINGDTHGNGESEVILSGGDTLVDDITLTALNHIIVKSGRFAPSSSSDLLYSSVQISNNSVLGFTNLQDILLNDFTGAGGTIVINPEQSITIEGYVTGQAKIGVGSDAYYQNISSALPEIGKVYVSAIWGAGENTFSLLPFEENPSIVLSSEDGLNWTAKEETVSSSLTFTDNSDFDLPSLAAGTAMEKIDVSTGVLGGTAPYTYSAEGLPLGISIHNDTGVISGIPASVQEATYATITVTDSSGNSKSITVDVGEITAPLEVTQIPQSLIVNLDGPSSEKAVELNTNVKIYNEINRENLTDILISCESLEWSPNVTDYYENDIVYTATIMLRAINGLSFPEDIKVTINSNNSQVNDIQSSLSLTGDLLTLTITFAETTPNGVWMEDVPDQTYTGKAIKPEIKVYYKDQLLTSKDYTVSYKNNISAATNDAVDAKGKSIAPTIIIQGKGNYTGTVTRTFTIKPINLDEYTSNSELQDILQIDPVYVNKTGKVIKASPVIKLNGRVVGLKEKQYILEYKDTLPGAYLEAGSYEITIVGSGKNFIGQTTTIQTITEKLISKVTITLDKESYPYNAETGETFPKTITVKDGKTVLEKDVHYTVDYLNYDKVGTATVVITGKGEYTGSKSKAYKITGLKLTSSMVKQTNNLVYTGEEHSIEKNIHYTIFNKEIELEEGRDYQLSYVGDRTKAGSFKVIFKGINGYTGSVTKVYTIGKEKVANLRITLNDSENIPFAKNGAMPKPEVRLGELLLTEGKDYSITYINNKKVASSTDQKAPSLYITGKGNFTGSTKNTPVKFSIVGTSLETQATISAEDILYKDKNKNFIPSVTLTDKISGKKLSPKIDYQTIYTYEIWDEYEGEFKDFTENKINKPLKRTRMRVTVQGTGNYSGSISAEYEIYLKSIAAAVVDKIPTQQYTGQKIEPQPVVTLKVKEGKKYTYIPLDAKYYEVKYENNLNKGTATLYLYGKGEYGGVKKVTFKIASYKLNWWKALFSTT